MSPKTPLLSKAASPPPFLFGGEATTKSATTQFSGRFHLLRGKTRVVVSWREKVAAAAASRLITDLFSCARKGIQQYPCFVVEKKTSSSVCVSECEFVLSGGEKQVRVKEKGGKQCVCVANQQQPEKERKERRRRIRMNRQNRRGRLLLFFLLPSFPPTKRRDGNGENLCEGK